MRSAGFAPHGLKLRSPIHDGVTRHRVAQGAWPGTGAIERTTQMGISPLAGKPAPEDMLVDLSRLEKEYFERRPDLDDPRATSQFRHQQCCGVVDILV
jgi:hypothetical protein